MSSLATQMRQEPSTETPMVNHVLSFRTETVHGWITKETVSPSLLRMTAMYMKRMEQASTGMVKVQMYTICLYSKAWISQKDIGLNKKFRDHSLWGCGPGFFVLYYVRGVYLYRKTWYNVNAAGDGTPGKYLEVFMEAYSDFARVYDIFMDNVEYEKWAEYLIGSLKEYGIEDGIVLELGCGTGVMTELLAESGYDMIGVDNSEEMLGEAMEKRAESGHEILYLEQDMREFELYGTVRAIVSVCDCMNYITEEEDLLTVFKLVNNYLDPDGIFIFDMNTPYKYREILGNTTIAENREEGSFIWENEFDEETGINVYDLTLFLPREDGLYERDEEIHYQKAYEPEKIRELLEKAGLIPLAVYDAYTKDAPKPDSGRLTFVAREHGKEISAEEK